MPVYQFPANLIRQLEKDLKELSDLKKDMEEKRLKKVVGWDEGKADIDSFYEAAVGLLELNGRQITRRTEALHARLEKQRNAALLSPYFYFTLW